MPGGPAGPAQPAAPARTAARDEVTVHGSERFGGPTGRRAAPATGFWHPVRVVALAMIGMFALGMVQKLPCYTRGWFEGPATQYTHACYSDIPHLYRARGFADGLIPYFDKIPDELARGMEYLEYPVLTGLFMETAAWLTPAGDGGRQAQQIYWLVNAGMLMACAVIIAVCVARIQRNRPWDGLMVALAPAFALTATINWDLLAGALCCAGLLMWARARPAAAGILIGLATAAKLYPVLVLGPLFLLCLRTFRWRAFFTTTATAVLSWLVVNLPIMLLATDGWARFYVFSRERSVDFGSFWLLLVQRTDVTLSPSTVNRLAVALTLLGFAGIALLAVLAPVRPRLAQLVFLTVAVFILTNKVYSPQYVLWLIPLAVLARPRWRDILIWQACEVLYFLGIWMYLAHTSGAHGVTPNGYHGAIALHLLGTLYLCLVVVRDILRPGHDPVRWDGSDDPGGGVLDRAADRFTLPPRRPRTPSTFHVKPPPPDPTPHAAREA
nr:glycosyltransferase 87 family protein [Streptomyces sp. YIM 98790]